MGKKLLLDEVAIVNAYLSGGNCYELAPLFGCNYGTIRNVLIRNGITLRTKSEAARSRRTVEITDYQREVIDGLLLGDASVFQRRRTAHFRLKSKDKEFANYVKDLLPFEFTVYSEPACNVLIRGKLCSRKEAHIIESLVYQSLNEFRDRWYEGRRKIVPKDLVLTPTICKYWFYSDGYTSRIHANGNDNCVVLGLCTNSFSCDETIILQRKLRALGFDFRIAKKVKGYILQARKKEAVNGFLEYIGASELQCFEYKWKKHRGSRPCRRRN